MKIKTKMYQIFRIKTVKRIKQFINNKAKCYQIKK